ncbi:hypothetical protein DFP72DRAFT_151859 [Ephemerocybe angulata]|uniref:MYND-type domain-containing protein n=1 Tax=Ephemerocybe angulata TaxID=980116 RepID=A0A8H6LUU8_9AGAR|nr:hypothetical protein DFP72DRAFT_151859 [Tulosesus angulatus]
MAFTNTGQPPIETIMSLEAAIDTLTTAMTSPLTTNICASRMNAASKRLQHAMFSLGPSASRTARLNFVNSIPQVLRAGMRFLTMKQSREAHVEMVARLVRCRCDELVQGKGPEAVMHMKRLHALDTNESPDVTILRNVVSLRATVNVMIILIKSALSGLTKRTFQTRVPGKAKKDQPWPLSLDDLFPFGMRDSVHGLELWADWEDLNGSLIYELATALGEFYPPFTRALLQPPDYSLVIKKPLAHLTAAMNNYEKTATHPDNWSALLFKEEIKNVFDYLQLFGMQDQPVTSLFFDILGANVAEMTPVFKRLLDLIASICSSGGASMKEEWSDTRFGIKFLLRVANKDFGPGDEFDSEEGLAEEVMQEALGEMARARKGGCANLRCPQKKDSANLRLCSKCDLIRYCGPECQKEAWKSLLFPHKPLCSQVHAFKSAVPKETWMSLWNGESPSAEAFRSLRSVRTAGGKATNAEYVSGIGKTLVEMREIKALYDETGNGESEAEFLSKVAGRRMAGRR